MAGRGTLAPAVRVRVLLPEPHVLTTAHGSDPALRRLARQFDSARWYPRSTMKLIGHAACRCRSRWHDRGMSETQSGQADHDRGGGSPPAPPSGGKDELPLWDLRRAVVRFALSSAVGVLVWIAHRPRVEWFIGAVLSWDASALAMIVLSWMVILRADPAETRRRAGAE